MKICHLTSVHTPFDTRIFYKECRSLSEAGYEVHLVTRHMRDDVVDGIYLHAVPGFPGKIKRILNSTRAVYKKALSDEYTLYHFHDPELIPVGLLLKYKGKKVVYDVHEDYPEYFKYKDSFPPALRGTFARIIGIIEHFVAGRFDAAVVPTPTIFERFRILNPNTALIHNFPSMDEFSPDVVTVPWQSKSDEVVYVGSLSLDRGIEEMVRAVGLVQERFKVRLLLAGDFVSKSDRDYITAMPEFSFVDYRGHTSREETVRLLARAKIGIVICHPHFHYQCAYPTKLFEYMLAGIPVITSDFPLWRSLVESVGCGLTVDPMNTGEIADAIASILGNSVEAKKMGIQGREAVESNYNWNTEKKTLLDLYEKILGKG